MTEDQKIEETAQQVAAGNSTLASLPLIGGYFDKRPKVSVLRMSGILTDSAVQRSSISHPKLSKLIDKAFAKADSAVVLAINSPGGSAAQSELIGNHIRLRAEETGLPVYAFVEDLAASGGYWLACAADKIFALESSIVGSIGVISAGFGFEDLIKHYHIKRRVHTSGENKSFLDPFLPEKESDVKRLVSLQQEIHSSFKVWVKDRRGDALQGTEKELFEGEFWAGKTALDKGLIDGLGDARLVMMEEFGENVKLTEFSPERKLPFPISMMRGGLDAHLSDKDEWLAAALDTIEKRAYWSRYGL